MSATTMNGGEALKPATPSGSKQPLKTTNSSTSTNTMKSLESARKQTSSPGDGQSKRPQAPKAWHGPNPITSQRSTANGIDRPPSKASPSTQPPKSSEEIHADKHAHDRSLYLFSQFVGKDATVTLKNGEQIVGVFSGASLESAKVQYVLKMAKRTKHAAHQQSNGDAEASNEYIGQGEDHAVTIDIQDTVDLFVPDVVYASANSQPNGWSRPLPTHAFSSNNVVITGSVGSSFLTDTQISGRDAQMPRAKELQRWVPGPDTAVDLSLDDESSGAGWDQFATNERMYGVQTSYDENIYTTALDRSNPNFKQRQAEADRIAREIEGSAATDAHVAEERKRDASRDDAGDEEEKYSGVQRDAVTLPKRAAGAYVPPSQRPITGAPTVPGAPFDPAIISTQIAKPAVQPATTIPDQAAAPEPVPADVASPSTAGSHAQTTPTSTENAVSPSQAPVVKKQTTTEDHVRGTADAFKHFANTEKLRVRQAQEAKRSNARQEKNVKLNDLKKFAANFKLKSRVPDDLVPILAKDREKQIEIQTKAEAAAKEEEGKTKDKESTSAVSPAPPSATQVTVAPVTEPRLPFNQHSRARGSQQVPRAPAPYPTPMQSPRAPLGQRFQQQQQPFGRPNAPAQPLPADLRLTTPQLSSSEMPSSPRSAHRQNLNANAETFKFRAAASAFTPSGSSPSPQRLPTDSGRRSIPVAVFFEKRKTLRPTAEAFNPLKRLADTEYTETQKRHFAGNGGIPQAYNTLPTWGTTKANEALMHADLFPKAVPVPSNPSPLHAPHVGSPMPHMHPGNVAHLHTPPVPMPPRPFWGAQQQQPMPPHFDPRMQHMPQYRASPNAQYRQPYQPQPPQPPHGGFPGMLPPQFQSGPPPPQSMPPQYGQPPPMMPPQFQGSPMAPYRMSPNLAYRPMPGAAQMVPPPQMQGGPPPMQPQFSQQGYMR